MVTKSNVEIKKLIESDEKLYKKFNDANIHIESFLEASDKDKKEYGGSFIQDVKNLVSKAEAEEAKKEKEEEEDDEESG